jgi:predicted GIY-YIG superfamily endonuclease
VLYVGIAVDLERRIAQHKANQPWWPEVANVAAWQFPTRAQARSAEVDANHIYQPQYNRADVNDKRRHELDQWRQMHQTWLLPIKTMEL